jgi:hypothetical protein
VERSSVEGDRWTAVIGGQKVLVECRSEVTEFIAGDVKMRDPFDGMGGTDRRIAPLVRMLKAPPNLPLDRTVNRLHQAVTPPSA